MMSDSLVIRLYRPHLQISLASSNEVHNKVRGNIFICIYMFPIKFSILRGFGQMNGQDS